MYNLNSFSPLEQCLLVMATLNLTQEANAIKVIKEIKANIPASSSWGNISMSVVNKTWSKLKKDGYVQELGKSYVLSHSIDDTALLFSFAKENGTLLQAGYNTLLNSIRPDRWAYHYYSSSSMGVSTKKLMALVKSAVAMDDSAAFNVSLDTQKRYYYLREEFLKGYNHFIESLLEENNGYREHLGSVFAAFFLNIHLYDKVQKISPISSYKEEWIHSIVENRGKGYEELLLNYVEYMIRLGRMARLMKQLNQTNHHDCFFGKAVVYVSEGKYKEANEQFEKALIIYQTEIKNSSNSLPFPNVNLMVFYYLLKATPYYLNTKVLAQAENMFKRSEYEFMPNMSFILSALQDVAMNKIGFAVAKMNDIRNPKEGLEAIFLGVVSYWAKAEPSADLMSSLKSTLKQAEASGYDWLAMEAAGLVSHFMSSESSAKKRYDKTHLSLRQKTGATPLVEMLPEVPIWERAALGMEQFFKNKKLVSKEERDERMVVFLDYKSGRLKFEIKIQKISKKGSWTQGRKATHSTLSDFKRKKATPEENPIITGLLFPSSKSVHYSEGFQYEPISFLRSIVGFPRIFHLSNSNVKMDLVEKTPKMFMEEDEQGGVVLHINHLPQNKEGYGLYKTGPTEYTLVTFTQEQAEFLSFFNKNEIVFPPSAGSRVVDFVDNIKRVIQVETLLEEDMSEYPKHAGDTTPHLHLLPVADVFRMELFAKPYPNSNQYFKPGAGRKAFKQDIDGKTYLVERDLPEEKKNVTKLLKVIKLPKRTSIGEMQWELENAEDCLRVLNQIHPLRDSNQVVLEWPKGEKFRLMGRLSLSDLELRISQGKDYWFGIDGKMKVNESLVFSFKQLLEMTENAKNGFVEVTDGQFMAITERLQKQLNLARGVMQKDRGDKMKFQNLAGLALDEMFEEVGSLKADEEWKEQRQKIAKAKNIKPRTPSKFKAELRPYQKEGFRWMMQLAEWGVGGCLADDMGLGKTIQALAVLVARASEGPAIVVAPASVCRNWLREAEKFAPSLNPLLFGSSDREEMVTQLKEGDLLIASYGLMQSEIEKLKEINFSMIILDEAQAIKNYDTKRFKAAIQLNAQFRMATTGTPVENHLGELWSLFAFVNPGLLGNKRVFAERYGKPIQRGEQDTVEQLKTLVRPFILRRKKSEVLKDLPPKTEIIHTVSMPEDEKAFYEASRRHALDKLEKDMEELQAGTQHLLVLAEITRLRRACCHPSLVDAKSNFPGAKLEAFREIIQDLRENGHRVLVFSQFVDYLKIVREWVEKEKIAYQYLDGSTPTKKREEAVNAFQKGEGELFLISLKAGGVGLNLTAADYVIIMDPWWNPAVEDQAADRAHRIGQQNPVTVYRLVVEGTIEEKIVQLHQQKRDLADTLLQGTDNASKITTKELLNILKEEQGVVA